MTLLLSVGFFYCLHQVFFSQLLDWMDYLISIKSINLIKSIKTLYRLWVSFTELFFYHTDCIDWIFNHFCCDLNHPNGRWWRSATFIVAWFSDPHSTWFLVVTVIELRTSTPMNATFCLRWTIFNLRIETTYFHVARQSKGHVSKWPGIDQPSHYEVFDCHA